MTNLEWIRTLSEEEFADWLYDEWLHHLQYRWSSSQGGLIIWLKDCKTEPTGYNLSPVDKDINVRSKDEAQFDYCPRCGMRILVDKPKDEPQPSKIIEAYAKGYKDGADAVKGIKDKQIRACDICKYEIGETCTHPKVKTMKKKWATFEGDLWGEENTPKWCPIDKDEPQERSE